MPAYRGTAIADLLAFHNLGAAFRTQSRPELVIGMCMDYRMWLRIPPAFAYVIRVAGANLRGLEFQISLALAGGGVNALCLVGHDKCAAVGLAGRRREFALGLAEHGGWSIRAAQNHFSAHAWLLEVHDEVSFLRSEAIRLSQLYPRILVAPLFYTVEDHVLYQVEVGA